MKKTAAALLYLAIIAIPCTPIVQAQESVGGAVTIDAGIDVTKESNVSENVNVTKDASLSITQTGTAEQLSASSAMDSSDVRKNKVTESLNLKDPGRSRVDSNATINQDAFIGVSGVLGVNQAPGQLNNQSNTVAVSYATGDNVLLDSSAAGSKSASENILDATSSSRTNLIGENAFGSVSGIIGVNQAAGHMNNQNNIVSISIGDTPIASLSDTTLRMISGSNTITEAGVTKFDIIDSNAFAGASGIISVNQSSGAMNSQVNIISISVNGSFVQLK